MDEIFDIISTFDRAKKAAFEKYVLSVYFVPDVKLAKLLLRIANQIYNGKTIEDIVKNHGKPSLKDKKAMEEISLNFLCQYEFDEKKTMRANLNLAGIRKRNIENLYKDTLIQIENLEIKEFDQSSEYFYFRSLIEKNIFELKTENKKKNTKVKIASELNMQRISQNVDIFYLLEIMKNFLSEFTEKSPPSNNDIASPEMQFSLKAAPVYENIVPILKIYRILIEGINNTNTNFMYWSDWITLIKNISHRIPPGEINLLKSSYKQIQKNINLTRINQDLPEFPNIL
ncbi:MAG: hypothetical protein IPL63_13300 [Saprospiraceae bacterium]|nr:hypothetical protein [Saprospiraceae bacterium]